MVNRRSRPPRRQSEPTDLLREISTFTLPSEALNMLLKIAQSVEYYFHLLYKKSKGERRKSSFALLIHPITRLKFWVSEDSPTLCQHIMEILLISDIHANFPALEAIDAHFAAQNFDMVINAGDSVVYAPFPNETLDWLQRKKALSIRGNTDQKVLKLLAGKTFKKPSKPEKRIMYTWTADVLRPSNARYLKSFPSSLRFEINLEEAENKDFTRMIEVFHGSPLDDDEFLFSDTPIERFEELARHTPAEIVVTGHSHSPFHRLAGSTHFINPGSVGRMFDGDPRASCAVLSVKADEIRVDHFRIPYPVEEVTEKLRKNSFPEIYEEMFVLGKKLN